ncbi:MULTISPECIES: dihydrodipicolinate synthase family protein [unclassified Ruegeria]|uniref:dihydrodipicolinate synthase family protein n=1 Tax=unclassified Ruegeria TaxID=2625375 RepID=UPI0014876518|nr:MULTISPECIES: dihydrodipicolinate synthase family protein [unclassified Ruegeria]NOD75877.1 dihydrodipicolinate synthase family protein [Ruegeria sp. HKCCD4332]NOD88841.1 dihydrodipicolinate synthase family protein [Ruegeria sp. HKCCD4318]NOE14573.1 dihydrodipicolinate synthase family protein [Ruegeria sp. HKCCD4318-2]NOG09906.1 dihydrodipicolinate synthase family protein [Ruegeria sp. HKCCD4315]
MNPIFKFEGIYTPVVTPYHDDSSVNWDALSDVIEYLIENGVHGLISGGSTGENYAQTVEERLELAKFTHEKLNGRLPLVVGTGAMLTSDSIALASGAREIGADAILLASPPYSVPTDRENALNALAIDKAADLPVMLYNYPHRTGTMMGEEFLDRVGRSRNFCGIKESSGDINRVHLLARDYPHIQLGCGMDDQALEFFAWGAPFWVCGGSNFLPAEHVALYNACVIEGDFAKGRRIMSAMMPLMRVLEQGGKFIQTIKHGVTMNGIDAGAMRPPLKGLNKDDKRALEQVTRVLKKTIADIVAEG